jgi:hypothetical protein
MPSLRDELLTVFCLHLVLGQTQTGANGLIRPGQASWTVYNVQNHTLWVTLLSSQPDGPPCWASPLAFGLIGPDIPGDPID